MDLRGPPWASVGKVFLGGILKIFLNFWIVWIFLVFGESCYAAIHLGNLHALRGTRRPFFENVSSSLGIACSEFLQIVLEVGASFFGIWREWVQVRRRPWAT